MITRLAVLVSLLGAACRTPSATPSRTPTSAPTVRSDAPGALHMTVVDENTGVTIVGARIVVTSRSLRSPLSVLTDSNGLFAIAGLPPGSYDVEVQFADSKTKYHDVPVSPARITAFVARIAPFDDVTQEIESHLRALSPAPPRRLIWPLIQASR